jgi:hypothetical protein
MKWDEAAAGLRARSTSPCPSDFHFMVFTWACPVPLPALQWVQQETADPQPCAACSEPFSCSPALKDLTSSTCASRLGAKAVARRSSQLPFLP